MSNIYKYMDRFEVEFKNVTNKGELSASIYGDKLTITYKDKNNLDVICYNALYSRYQLMVDDTNHRSRLDITKIDIPGKINGICVKSSENTYLLLDSEIDLDTQLNALREIDLYFYLDRKYVVYLGEVSKKHKLFDRVKDFDFIKRKESDEFNTDILLAIIKLNISKLDLKLKNFVSKKITEIYKTPEQKLAEYVDLTKPIGEIGDLSVSSDLERLSTKLPILVEASELIMKLKNKERVDLKKEFPYIDDDTRKEFERLVDSEYSSLYDLIINNAINVFDGGVSIDLDKEEKKVSNRITNAYFAIVNYYNNNSSAFEILNSDSELGIHVLESKVEALDRFYGTPNTELNEKLKNLKDLLTNDISTKSSTSLSVSKYNAEITEFESFFDRAAYVSCINAWKHHQFPGIYNNDALFMELNKELANLDLAIKSIPKGSTFHINSYEKAAYRVPREFASDRELEIIERIDNKKYLARLFNKAFFETYTSVYDSSVEKIEKTYLENGNNDSYVPVDKKEIYNSILHEVIDSTNIILRKIDAWNKRTNIDSWISGVMECDYNDKEFLELFNLVKKINNELTRLNSFLKKDINNKKGIEYYYNDKNAEYNNLLSQLLSIYNDILSSTEINQMDKNSDKLKAILDSLNELLNVITIICDNEDKLMEAYSNINKQKRI